MQNYRLIHMFETLSNGYSVHILDLITVVSIIATVLIIISKNPIVSVLFLIGLFFSIACYLILLGLNFIGISYLLVYVGAVSILFLFILMLINVRVSELVTENTNSIPLVLVTAVLFMIPAQQVLPLHTFNVSVANLFFNMVTYLFAAPYNNYTDKYAHYNTNNTLCVTSKLWDGNIAEATHITSIGNVMYTNYSMWLIITSIILLLAMVGTIVINLNNTNQSDEY